VSLFLTFDHFTKAISPLISTNPEAFQKTLEDWNTRTKPAGSLGRLESIAAWVASVQNKSDAPEIKRMRLHLFAGSHGVTAERVSMCPDHINGQMFRNFKNGGAAINTLCASNGIRFEAFDAGIEQPTQNMLHTPAMTEPETLQALKLGWESLDSECDLFAVGEMGIGNTTPSAAILSLITGQSVETLTGRGAGLPDDGFERKKQTLAKILENRRSDCSSPLRMLAAVGGREIAAMCGAILRAASMGIPIVLDGVIAGAAAAIAFELCPACRSCCIAGHRSEEPAHSAFLNHYQLDPILDLGMRLGEGTGAAVAMGIVKNAVDAFRNMATFESAGVVL